MKNGADGIGSELIFITVLVNYFVCSTDIEFSLASSRKSQRISVKQQKQKGSLATIVLQLEKMAELASVVCL